MVESLASLLVDASARIGLPLAPSTMSAFRLIGSILIYVNKRHHGTLWR